MLCFTMIVMLYNPFYKCEHDKYVHMLEAKKYNIYPLHAYNNLIFGDQRSTTSLTSFFATRCLIFNFT